MIANSYTNMGRIREAIHAIYRQKRKLGITQEVIADRIGCTQSFVSEMLSGDKHMNDEAIEGFCDALGVNLSDLEAPSVSPKERSELLKLRFVLDNTRRSEKVLRAVIEAAYKELVKKPE